ncbi:KPN_02809 family neutral zinc metallopeptidase [Paracoccus aestuariivivens]|uniref:Flagellar biosynthesis protein FlgM n=1 Tax=Paracoccus aestuariivivens TaxID=1820333 RepID=A0A6L6JFR4_9RHOB|nr:neutral zinc metallopeptidase [Paracoccus aestuariivivens]MTH78731.1 hypothetical protein [Paracoccus aestuariivivens]
MLWRGRRESQNVDDRRGMGASAGGIGIIGVLCVLAVGYFFGIDISPIMSSFQGQQSTEQRELTAEEQELGQFASVVLADTEEVWGRVLSEQTGIQYTNPQMVLFSGAVQSACGGASAAMGPFYCPNDQKLYLDTDFFKIMQQKMGAGGDFAFAYVIAHEVGHHVQNLTGILGETMKLRQQTDEVTANRISVLTELQADCFAGIWGRQASDQFGTIEDGDIEEAINAAAAVGDDTLMKDAGRAVRPESFTHGSAQDRMAWFKRGFSTGQLAECNTFKEVGM